ncbi:MAG: histidine phosphatase family protein [Candidatus Heimdallarchaeota archaeon]|nr:histidine phosphatase family protein [Candidatus Heimdallarchaeota archaeon]
MDDRHLRLFLIRHGMDRATAMQKFADEQLTIEGIEQVTKLSSDLHKEKINRIYSSPSKRSMETSSILSVALSSRIIDDQRLKPRDLGLANNKSYSEVQRQYHEIFRFSSFSRDFKFPDGETNAEVFERTGRFIEDLVMTTQGVKESIAIVSSALVLNYLVYHLHNIGFQDGMLYIFEFGQVAIFESQGVYFQLLEFYKPR